LAPNDLLKSNSYRDQMITLKENVLLHDELNMLDAEEDSIVGRSIFIIEITGKGILVQTSFETMDGRLLEMPAIFPNIEYALAQIDEMRRLVVSKFSEAATIGIQSISSDTLKKKAREEALAYIAVHKSALI
jgi:hypothetical protein